MVILRSQCSVGDETRDARPTWDEPETTLVWWAQEAAPWVYYGVHCFFRTEHERMRLSIGIYQLNPWFGGGRCHDSQPYAAITRTPTNAGETKRIFRGAYGLYLQFVYLPMVRSRTHLFFHYDSIF